MSDWVMAEWRVAPKGTYAFAFFAMALLLSATIVGLAMVSVPTEGAFDNSHVEMVAENRLTTVESLWVIPPHLRVSDQYDGSFNRLYREYPTVDFTVRWVVDSFFKLAARNKELEKQGFDWYRWFYLDGLLVVIDEAFGRVAVDGTYCAWDLWFNGTRVHFDSDTVEKLGHIPENHWTVSHDYSGKVIWWRGIGELDYHAKLRFHLWFPTEDAVL